MTAVEPLTSEPAPSVTETVVAGGTAAKVALFDRVKVIEPVAKSVVVELVDRTTMPVALTTIELEAEVPMKFSAA